MTTLAGWVAAHATRIETLDPTAALDDLEPLRDLVGDARVVALGESAHRVREFHLLRHRLLRFLVERCGFTAYTYETGYTEAPAIDAWMSGGPGDLATVAAGIAHGVGYDAEARDQLAWLRSHNNTADRPVRFAGCLSSPPLVALRRVAAYLERTDRDAMPLVARALDLVTAYHHDSLMAVIAAYGELPDSTRDELTATLSRLLCRLQMAGSAEAEAAAAVRQLRSAWYLDHLCRDLVGRGLPVGTACLDAFAAEAVLDLLDDDGARVVVAMHNTHIRRTVGPHDEVSGLLPQGHHLARALGDRYVAIGMTAVAGRTARMRMAPDRPRGYTIEDCPLPDLAEGSVEAAFCGVGSAAVADLRAARPCVDDADTYRHIRMEDYTMESVVVEAFDAVACVPTSAPTSAVGRA